VRFQVLTGASMKMNVSWDIAPCSPVEIDGRFRGAYCLNRQVDVSYTGEDSVASSCDILMNLPW
jgi:hypothetical protein